MGSSIKKRYQWCSKTLTICTIKRYHVLIILILLLLTACQYFRPSASDSSELLISDTPSYKLIINESQQALDTSKQKQSNLESKQKELLANNRKLKAYIKRLKNESVISKNRMKQLQLQSCSMPINISIIMWLQKKSYSQQSYSYATSKDIIISYDYQNIEKNWFLWFLELNNLSPSQFVWINYRKFSKFQSSSPLLKNAKFIKEMCSIISNQFETKNIDTIILKPFWQIGKITPLIDKIKSFLPQQYTQKRIMTAIADKSWMNKFGTKACLHRYISNLKQQSLVESVNMFVHSNDLGFTETKGYLCRNKSEILIAFDILTHEIGHNNVLIKYCNGMGGIGIYFYNNKTDIINTFSVQDDSYELISVEEDLRYNGELEIENIDVVGISFYNNEIIGGGHQQIIEGNSVFKGSKKYLNKLIEDRLKKITKYDVMDKIGTQYVGGFDYAIQKFKNRNILPKIYLIDFNTGRYTSTMQTFVVMERFNIQNKFYLHLNMKIETNATFSTLIRYYSELLFNEKTKKGIFFHVFYPKDKVAVLSIFGDNEQEANLLYEKFKNISFVVS